ncbi:hypothetical protein BDM02DRAFT_69277 [Thelephora ganbajun]|uniref:Uncharacterized protein n=1 Tax=Thelephora ganbajun TaxID=370292 RepID=A0ACB6ZXI9_THEGA|nr:hypothetical protein BDM02DRAFT_69277 [Thelephora ganbajun]
MKLSRILNPIPVNPNASTGPSTSTEDTAPTILDLNPVQASSNASAGPEEGTPVPPIANKLYLNDNQLKAVSRLYDQGQEYRKKFNSSHPSQSSAKAVLDVNGIPQLEDRQSRDRQPQNIKFQDIRPQDTHNNCWLTASSNSWGTAAARKKRAVFQCSSGYCTAARQARDRRGSLNLTVWSRHTDYEFTECLAHAVVTWNLTSRKIEQISGYFHHNVKCAVAPVIRSAEVRSSAGEGPHQQIE